MAIKLNTGVALDPLTLVDTRLLVQANSGAGKSWLLRLVIEQAAKTVPTIVLDSEGEFPSLREAVDVVLVGSAGEVASDVRSAGLLARKLLQLRVSAVIDLYDLKLHERRRYVRLFLESLLHLPKTLWHPTLVVIDEAHKFCPERSAGEAESSGAVIDLCSQGRKRGYGALLATQRLSKLHKDAAAELNNVAIGRTTLDIDAKRALDLLGMPASQKNSLRNLRPGEFLMFGPACGWNDVKQFRTAKPKSTHPQAGKRHKMKAPKPSGTIRKVLGEFADLPEEAESEIRDLNAAKKQIVELKRQVSSKAPVVDERATERAVTSAVKERDRHWSGELKKLEAARGKLVGRLQKIGELASVNGEAPAVTPPKDVSSPSKVVPFVQRQAASRESHATDSANYHLGGGALRMVQVLAIRSPAKFTEAQWATLSKLKRTGGTWSTYKSRLLSAGLVAREGDLWLAMDLAVDQYGASGHAPETAEEVREQWKEKLGSGPSRMIDALFEHGPLDREALAEACGLTANAGTFGTYLSRLRSNGLVIVEKQCVELSEMLL